MTVDDSTAMQAGDLSPFERVLHRARVAAYPPGEFVGQESFMTATEIRELATTAGVGPGVRVLDLCCGPGGPAHLLTGELGCRYLGLDASASAVAIATARTAADSLACRFVVAHVPPLPPGPFDVVLLLETMLAFAEKAPLLRAVVGALRPGGRFACTLEAGEPLSAAEQAAMSLSHTVHLASLESITELLERVGLTVTSLQDRSAAHRATAHALSVAYAADGEAIAAHGGRATLEHLVASHRLWVDWLGSGRVRKLALVAERA